jgi:AcrR family transcriptional regulator
MTDYQSVVVEGSVAKRKKTPEIRRSDLIAAAKKAFAKKGVADAAVSDIVRAAGVAQGTFYLYFDTKGDIVNALAEQMAETMVAAVEKAVASTGAGAVDKLLALRDAILEMANDSTSKELAAIYHRPENRAVHDRMTEHLTPRLAPLVEQIVSQGIAERVFTAEDPRVAAWFILGGLHMLEVGFADPAVLPSAVSSATAYVLRALGYNAAAAASAS